MPNCWAMRIWPSAWALALKPAAAAMTVVAISEAKRISAASVDMGVVEEIVFHRCRFVLDGADALHEFGERVGVLRRDLELHFRVLDDLQQQVAVDLGIADADVGIGRLVRVGDDKFGGFIQCGDEGFVGLGIIFAKFFRCVQDGGRRWPAEHLIRVQYDVCFGIARQFLFLKRRVAEMRADFGTAVDDGGSGVGMRYGDADLVELVVLSVAPLFGGGQCSTRDCTETPTAGRAMRSLSLRSAMVLTLGLLLTR